MRLIGGLLTGLLLLALPRPASAAQDTERMLTYAVSAAVGADGSVQVTERIRYHFSEPRHGIFRFIPLYYPLTNPDGSVNPYDARKLELENYSATVDGADSPLVHDTASPGSRDNFILKVGDELQLVTGDHDYEFHYRIKGLLNAPGGHPELFWQALGGASLVPVDHAVVTVTAPGALDRIDCRAGPRPCTGKVDGAAATFTADALGAQTALTVTVALPPTVAVPPPIVRASRAYVGSVRDNLLHPGREAGIPDLAVRITVLGFVLGLLVLVVLFWRSRDRYFALEPPGVIPHRKSKAKKKRRLRAQTEAASLRLDPPPGIPVGMCGVILYKRADRRAITATVTDLAIRGHLVITAQPGGRFHLSRGPATSDKLTPAERAVLGAVKTTVELPAKGRRARPFRRALGMVAFRLMKDAHQRKWFGSNPGIKPRGLAMVALLLSLIGLFWLKERGLMWWWIPVAGTILLLAIPPGRAYAGRTAVGSAVLSQVLDFRQYLASTQAAELAEAERRVVFNRYLPYAQVFGLAQHWTSMFAALGAALPTDWYSNTENNGYLVDYSTFGSAIESFASSVSVSTDTSSSSGWSGGSSGFGGDSGGGGGGDGGGGGGAGSW